MFEATVAFFAFAMLALLRVPMAFAMGIVGFVGVVLTIGFDGAMLMLSQTTYDVGMSYTLSIIPLFILMGNFIVMARLSEDLYAAAYAFFGDRKGGLATSTIIACAGFSSLCGSSIATAATMSKVAYPEMAKFRYKDTLAAGSIAAGGTLGILIPPSGILVIYGIITETSISKLFAAGVIPGIIATALLCVAVKYVVWRDPEAGPPGERTDWKSRLECLIKIWPVVLLLFVVIGGIYAGAFTVTEAAGIGATGALLIAMAKRRVTASALYKALIDASKTTAMIFMIIIGAMIFANYMNYTSMPATLQAFVKQFEATPIVVIIAIATIYVVLGTVMEELSMILLTVPLFFPIVVDLGYDAIWFGIIVVVVVEIGLISPPVGMNIFVLRSQLPKVSLAAIYRGVTPFVIADIIRLGILIALPVLSLWATAYVK